MHKIRKIGRGVFGVAILCALGVGATSALAEPAQANWPYSCKPEECSNGCIGNGAQGGYCNYHDDSCECIW